MSAFATMTATMITTIPLGEGECRLVLV